jgi:hypothetical protein
MPKTLWAVTQGCYSDYRVLCVCPTEAIAELVAEKYNATERYGDAITEEFPLIDDCDPEPIPVLWMRTRLCDASHETDREEWIEVYWPFDMSPDDVVNAAVSWSWARAADWGTLRVGGVDHERVRRVFSQKRAELMTTPAYLKQRDGGRVPLSQVASRQGS